MKDLNKIPKSNEDLAWRRIDREVVILQFDGAPDEKEKILILNETAAMIWELIDGKNEVKDIIGKLLSEYEVSEEDVCKKITNLMNKFEKKGLITYTVA